MARTRGQGWQRGLTTAQRGLGNDHQKERKRLLAALRPGDACARCEYEGRYHPLPYGFPALIEVDDFPPRVVARALGVTPVKRLSWKKCNRRHGARLGNKIKAARRAARPSSYTRW